MTNGHPVGVGLIGAGMIGQGHAYALRLLAEDGDVRPVAVTDFSAVAVAAARRICPFETVAASARTAQVGFHSRFHPLVNELVRLTRSGELGAPMGYTLRDDQYWPTGDVVPGHSSWRSQRAQAGGGALIEHSIHSADILSWLFGPATSVYARTRNVFGYDV